MVGYPVNALCRKTWELVVEGKRHFIPGVDLDEDLLDGLHERDVRVVRTTEGKTYEFRHDEMRGYLAARWAAYEDVSPITLLEKTEKIWRPGRDDQVVVWEFFAEMIESEMGEGDLALGN